jgi:acetyl-CoA C-acetyltransferase
MPVTQYALLENALRAAEKLPLAAHREQVARLWASFSRVAAGNPDAWSRDAVSAEALLDDRANPPIAFPYGRLHCSQWTVDQACGLVLCSLGTARALGLPAARRLFPLAVADANHMLPATERRELHRSPGFAAAAECAFAHAGLTPEGVAKRELYSCFPVAVRVQQREIGLAEALPATVTGGMTFAGGPLNHFALQALVRLAQVLRDDPGAGTGLLTAVSGMLTKQGVSLWSREPGANGFLHADVSEATAAATAAVAFATSPEGDARIASYTVLFTEGAPTKLVLLCDLERGGRVLAHSDAAELARLGTREELCGRAVRIAAGGVATLR